MIKTLFLSLFAFSSAFGAPTIYWWCPKESKNFGDEMAHVIIEKLVGHQVQQGYLDHSGKLLLSVGSVLSFAREHDVIWGSGFRELPPSSMKGKVLDIRAVRGPRSRKLLQELKISCPQVYGDPAILFGHLFPEYCHRVKRHDYILIPNLNEIRFFLPYNHLVLPTRPWEEVVEEIAASRLVISSSLHGIIIAESLGVPARLLRMTWGERLLKYQDYYESTGRINFKWATSVQEALEMGGEAPPRVDIRPLLDAFPWDFFDE